MVPPCSFPYESPVQPSSCCAYSAARRWFSSTPTEYAQSAVNVPAAHVALILVPRWFVGERYFVTIACIEGSLESYFVAEVRLHAVPIGVNNYFHYYFG